MPTMTQVSKNQYCPRCNKIVTATRNFETMPLAADIFLGIFTLGLWWAFRLGLFILLAFTESTHITSQPKFICTNCGGPTRLWY